MIAVNSITRALLATAAAGSLMFGLTACNNDSRISTPESMCGYLVGKGDKLNDGGNNTVNHILWPTQTMQYDSDFDAQRYFPCGSRNYVVGENSNDDKADGRILLDVRTKQGTEIHVSVTIYWTPNEHDGVIQQFIKFCQKYNCASDSAGAEGGGNFSTDGWNGMLKENVHPVLQRLASIAFRDIDDDVWINDDAKLKESAAKIMADNFFAEFQKVSGFTTNLICASGSPGGKDDFDCQQPRVVVDKVVAAAPGLQALTDNQAKQKRMTDLQVKDTGRVDQTNTLYGPLAPQYRACQDLAASGVPVTCVIGGNGVQVQVPQAAAPALPPAPAG